MEMILDRLRDILIEHYPTSDPEWIEDTMDDIDYFLQCHYNADNDDFNEDAFREDMETIILDDEILDDIIQEVNQTIIDKYADSDDEEEEEIDDEDYPSDED